MTNLAYKQEEITELEKVLPRLPEHARAPIHAAIRHMRTEIAGHADHGPCPETAPNRTPCARWAGHPGLCTPSQCRGPATDTWTVTTADTTEVARVTAPTAEEARRAAERIPAARRASARFGGLHYRRLGAEEV